MYRKKFSYLNVVSKASHDLVLTFLISLIFDHSPPWTSYLIVANHIQFLYTAYALWFCLSSSLRNTFHHLAKSTHLPTLSSGTFREFQVEIGASLLSATDHSTKSGINLFVCLSPLGYWGNQSRDYAVVVAVMVVAKFVSLTKFISDSIYELFYLIVTKPSWSKYY